MSEIYKKQQSFEEIYEEAEKYLDLEKIYIENVHNFKYPKRVACNFYENLDLKNSPLYKKLQKNKACSMKIS